MAQSEDIERKIIALDRLRLLSLGYYISGAIGAIFVSFLLFHLIFLVAFSFVPASEWNRPASSPSGVQDVSPTPSPKPTSTAATPQGPPAILFRIFAGVIGVIIICGWTLGALTA